MISKLREISFYEVAKWFCTNITMQKVAKLFIQNHTEAFESFDAFRLLLFSESFTDEDILAYGHRRYRRVQALSEHFWCRWKKEYLATLQARHKWRKTRPCVAVGDLVLIRAKNVPRNSWSPGRVSSVHKGHDGLVRTVSLVIPPLPGSSKNRFVDRATRDLVLLVPASSHQCKNYIQPSMDSYFP